MSQDIRQLEPKAIWNKFADLNCGASSLKKRGACDRFYERFWKKSKA